MALMSSLSRHVFHPLWNLKDGKHRLRILPGLLRSQWSSVEAMRERQLQHLRHIVRYAAKNSPYYGRIFAEHRFNPEQFTLEAFQGLPVLTKADIRASTDEILSREFARSTLGMHKTGGSTGVALTTYFDPGVARAAQRRCAALEPVGGLLPWHEGRLLWGNPPVPRTFKQRLRAKLIDRFVYLDTMDFSERSVADFIERWRREGAEVLFGHAHSLYMLARYVIAHGIQDLRPRGIVSTSMMLLANERQVIEQAFSCKVFDRYGSEEVGLIASECERHEGLHLSIEQLYIEFLKPDGTHGAARARRAPSSSPTSTTVPCPSSAIGSRTWACPRRAHVVAGAARR